MKKSLLLAALLTFCLPQAFSWANPSVDVGAEVLNTLPPEGYPIVKGVVRRVDHMNQKVTIKHEDIPNLDMPGMTMPFAVRGHEMLSDISPGSRIRFVADNLNGVLTVIWIEKIQ